MAKNLRTSDKEWFIIVNPNAGTRKGERDWPKIQRLLVERNFSFDFIETTHKEHAIGLTTTAIKKGYRKFIVVGGDGTLNEVVNGIFMQKLIPPIDITIAMIPVGTGNDWCRTFGVPFHYPEAVSTIQNGTVFVQDIGKVNYYNSKKRKLRYFINIAGMGYDAEVAMRTNVQKDKGKGGPMVYIWNLLASLFYYKHSEIQLNVDGESTKCKAFSVSVGICRYNGGGMKQLPHAIPDDGLLDVTLIKKIGKLTVITQINKLFDGSFVNHPKIKTFTGKKITVDSQPGILLEVDGESLGHSPFSFDIIPKALNVIAHKMPSTSN